MNRDRLSNADHKAVAEGSMAVLDRLQTRPAAVQVLASAVVFMEVMERHGVRPSDAFEIAGNMVETVQGVQPDFRALKDYVRYEL